MGVKGLLPCLQSITRTVSLERYRGLTVAVDAMSWLHKGVFACDVKALAKSQRSNESEKPTSTELKCIKYTINKTEQLMKFGIEVILVIDGDSLPSKKEENAQRREERDKAFEKAMAAEKARDSRAARRFYAQSCSVTHKIRYELIKACKQLGIAFMVAPYEADSQMARLAHAGIVDLVLTEDSDILVYGCPRALFKVDFDTNRGQEIQLMRDLGENSNPSFRNWTHDMFVFMCIISGCDYCKGVPGIGIKLAHKLVRVHRSAGKIFSALRAAGRMPPAEGGLSFEDKFWIAFRTFRHQRVFCPSKQKIETLWPIAGTNHDASPDEVWPFLGEYIEPHIASKIADGTLHPSKKIVWDEALAIQNRSGSTRPNSNDVQIHRRPSNSNTNHNRRDATREKPNVWRSLVYGQTDDTRRSCQAKHDGKENEPNRSAQNHGSKRDNTFCFFGQKKKLDKLDAEEATGKSTLDSHKSLPPLQEIYVGTDDNSQPKSNYAPPAHHKDVPIHFHEYSSSLVGKTFKPISRKRRKQENDGTKSSKYIQKIWEKCAEDQQAAQPPKEKPGPTKDEDEAKEAGGVSLFKKDKSKVNTSCVYDNRESDYFRISTDETYRGSNSQQNYEMEPSSSVQQRSGDHTARQDHCHHFTSSDTGTYEKGSLHASHNFYSRSHTIHRQKYPEDDVTTFGDVSRVEAGYHAQYSSNDRSSQQLGYEPNKTEALLHPQEWYSEDDTTLYKDMSGVQAGYHAQYSSNDHMSQQPVNEYKAHNAEALHQHHFESTSSDSRHVEFKYPSIEQQYLLPDLQSLHDTNDPKMDPCHYQVGYEERCLDEARGASTRVEFEQLQTIKKKRHNYDDCVDWVSGNPEFSYRGNDETHGGGSVTGVIDSEVVLEAPITSLHKYVDYGQAYAGCSLGGVEGSDTALEAPVRSEFAQLQTVKKQHSDPSYLPYTDHIRPVVETDGLSYETYAGGSVGENEGNDAVWEAPVRSEFEQLQTVKKKRGSTDQVGPAVCGYEFPFCDGDEICGGDNLCWQ